MLHSSCARRSLSPDFRKFAVLVQPKLAMCDAFTSKLLYWRQLPSLSADVCHVHAWGWDPTGRYLVLPSGEAWAAGDSTVAWSAQQSFGLAFLDTHTGACPVVQLDAARVPAAWQQTKRQWAHACFCPDRGLVLVCQLYAPLAVRLYDCQGNLVSSHLAPELSGTLHGFGVPTWAPAGTAVVLKGRDATLWVWDFKSEPKLVYHTTQSLFAKAWETPYTSNMLLHADRQDCPWYIIGPTQLAARDGKGRAPVSGQSSEHQLGAAGCYTLVWGRRLAVLSNSHDSGRSWSRLQLYSMQDGRPVLQHTLTNGKGRVFVEASLQLSVDGQLAALLTGHPTHNHLSYARKGHLAVVHLASGTMRTFALLHPGLANMQEFCSTRLRWSPDSQAVLVTDGEGVNQELISFAAT